MYGLPDVGWVALIDSSSGGYEASLGASHKCFNPHGLKAEKVSFSGVWL